MKIFNFIKDQQNRFDNSKLSKILRYVSLALAVFPLLLILFCVIASKGEGENGAGAIMWLVVFYYWSLGIPVAVVSVASGTTSYLKQKNIIAIISIILALLPFAFFLLYS